MPIGARSVSVPSLAAAKWPWLGHQVLTAWFVVMLAVCLGLLSFAAVREIECRDEPIIILKLEDGISNLVAEQKHRTCRLALGPAPDRFNDFWRQ